MNKEILIEVLNESGVRIEETAGLTFSHEGLASGNGSNVWYFKDHSGSGMIIKEYPLWVDNGDISWIHEYMKQLAQKEFPLAKAIGKPVLKDGHYYALYEYADGLQFDRENDLHSISVAQTLRKLHDISRNIKIFGSRNWPHIHGYRPTQDLLTGFDLENRGTHLKVVWDKADNLLRGKSVFVMPIHGDFRRDNMRFDQTGVTKVFDFGNSRNDYAEVDLAITLRDISNPNANCGAFLRAYRDSGVGSSTIIPEAICASSLILSIQECLYLWREIGKNQSVDLEKALARESEYLESQLGDLPQQLSNFREIFFNQPR